MLLSATADGVRRRPRITFERRAIIQLAVLLFGVLINSSCHAAAAEDATTPPQQLFQYMRVEGATTLRCLNALPADLGDAGAAETTSEPVVWFRKGKRVESDSRHRLIDTTLNIDPVDYNDQAPYECRSAARPDVVLSSIHLFVTVRGMPEPYPEGPHAFNLHAGCLVWLNCLPSASDHPGNRVQWYRYEKPVELVYPLIRQSGNHLLFANATRADTGNYWCKAWNADTKKPLQVQLNTYSMDLERGRQCPNYWKHTQKRRRGGRAAGGGAGGGAEHPVAHEVLANENDAAWLACEVGGKKKQQQQHGGVVQVGHSVKWLKDGKLLRHAELVGVHEAGTTVQTEQMISENGRPREDSRIVVNPRNATLHLTAVFASDSGLYECHLYNEHDTQIAHRRTTLRVIEQLRFAPQPTSKNIELGTVAKIHCKVQGTPTPTVQWTKNGEPIPAASAEDVNGTLVFRNASASDRGNYTCSASSTQGTISADIIVGVVVAPRFLLAPQGPLQLAEGSSVWMHCQATGDPMPTIQWDKDLMYLGNGRAAGNSSSASTASVASDRYVVLPNGTLHIAEVHADEDEGQYGCTIGSSAGLKREEIRMTVIRSGSGEDYVGDVEGATGDGFMITRAVLITMSVAFAYIILVVGLMLWCRFRRQARKARLNLLDKDAIENGGTGGNGDLKMCEIEPCLPADKAKQQAKLANGNGAKPRSAGGDVGSDSTHSKHSASGAQKASNFDAITIPREALASLVQVGAGDFGDVFVGKIRAADVRRDVDSQAEVQLTVEHERADRAKSKQSLNEISECREEEEEEGEGGSNTSGTGTAATVGTPTATKPVLVKALTRVKDESVGIEFRRQIEMFRAVSHRSVCKLYGLVRDKDPHLLVLEHGDVGDLKQWLKSQKGADRPAPGQLLQLAWQVARGMDAIYRARYIHKDLAARNCVLSAGGLEVRISYGGLNREAKGEAGAGYAGEYAKLNNEVVPLRWLAPECLHDDDYSTKSDVYAYGVLVWELFGDYAEAKAEDGRVGLPLAELSNDEVVQRLREGKLERRLAEATPKELEVVLTSCWSANPKERPSFHTLHTAIAKCMNAEKLKPTPSPK